MKIFDKKGLENEKYIQFEHNNVILLHQKAKIEKDGYLTFINEKGNLIYSAVIVPIINILFFFPLLIYLYNMRNIIFIAILLSFVVIEYNAFMIFIKYKRNYNKIQLVDEKHPYKHII